MISLLLLIALQDAVTPAPTKALHDVVVDAIRNCPHAKGDEIAVCARDRGFAEKYRIEKLNKPQAALEEPKIKLSGVGSAVPGGCTSASAVGTIGCSKRDYDDWAAWKRKQEAEGRTFPW